MSLTRAIIGTLRGIPRAVRLADEDDASLHEIAEALQEARDAIREELLQREANRVGRLERIRASQPTPSPTEGTAR